MAEDSYRIWCLVEGDTTIFPVTTPLSLPIGELKKLIKEEGINDTTILAKDLMLWQVRMIMASYSTTNSPKSASRSRRLRNNK
jgi:hypothetical protein